MRKQKVIDFYTMTVALISGFVISLISFGGVLTLSVNTERLRMISKYLVALAAGTMVGGAVFHLIPEAVESLGGFTLVATFSFITGIIVSYLLEMILEWHHCRQIGGCEVPTHRHSIGAMNLFGDSVHNFLDGLVIAASFLTSLFLGVMVTIVVALHEIPQEFGDFGVLIQAGYSRRQALAYNFLSATMAIVGIVTVFILGGFMVSLSVLLLPFSAGNFIYIALTDLMPELHKERRTKQNLTQSVIMLIGIAIMAVLLFLPFGVH